MDCLTFKINCKTVHNMDARSAETAPRIHQQWLPDLLLIESSGFEPATLGTWQNLG